MREKFKNNSKWSTNHDSVHLWVGEYELSALTPYVVQQFITGLMTHGNLKTGKGLAANTVNSIITVIQQSMETAHQLKFTQVYEMNNLKRPRIEENDRMREGISVKHVQKIKSIDYEKNSDFTMTVRYAENIRIIGGGS